MDLLWVVVSGILSGFGGGLLSGFGLRWLIGRRTLRTEVAIADLQKIVLSLKGVKYSEARWAKRDLEEQEMRALKAAPPAAAAVKYDNDWNTGRPE